MTEAFPLSPAIPTESDGGNHTRAFTRSAASKEAHVACLNISKVLALTGLRVLTDDDLAQQVIDRYPDSARTCAILIALEDERDLRR